MRNWEKKGRERARGRKDWHKKFWEKKVREMPAPQFGFKLWQVREIAIGLRVSTQTVRKYMADGELESVRIGGRLLITDSGLNRYLEKHTKREKD